MKPARPGLLSHFWFGGLRGVFQSPRLSNLSDKVRLSRERSSRTGPQ